ncbi:MAG: tetratricopeptide repeat protein [Bacteroidetes bacterium]|nr:MAG: tetratricopeptide repeat protein [Bacteroidota bacterium]
MAFLGSLTAMWCLWQYWESGRGKWLVGGVISYAAALFFKENAITFLAIFPLVGYFFTRKSLPEILKTTLLFIVPAAVYLSVRHAVIGDVLKLKETVLLDNLLFATTSTTEQLATAILLLGKYLKTLFFPHPLSSDWGYNQIPITDFSDLRVWLSGLVHLGLLVAAIRGLKKRAVWAFAILFYFINFSIFSNIFIKIGSSYGDRFLYSASPGFAIAAAWGLMKLFKVSKNINPYDFRGLWQKNKVFTVVSALIIVLFSLKTISRNPAWYDSFTLYQTDVKVAPNSAKLNYHYGLELAKKGDEATGAEREKWYREARKHLNKALEIFPQYHDAYARLGLVDYYEKRPESALKNYELALRYKPNYSSVYSNMGTLLFEQKRYDEALEAYKKSVELDPRFVDGWRNLGSLYALSKRYSEAIACFQKGLEIEPDNAILNFYLGQAYRDSGQPERGVPFLEKARRLDPSLPK